MPATVRRATHVVRRACLLREQAAYDEAGALGPRPVAPVVVAVREHRYRQHIAHFETRETRGDEAVTNQ